MSTKYAIEYLKPESDPPEWVRGFGYETYDYKTVADLVALQAEIRTKIKTRVIPVNG